MPRTKQEFIKRLRDSIDNYQQSVVALHAFAASSRWDPASRSNRPGSQFCIPRRMTVVRQPADAGPVRTVTPDAVVQVSNEYGIVGEMKKHFPEHDQDAVFNQLQKYGRALAGWWTTTETVAAHDVVLLTQSTSSTDAVDAYRRWLSTGNTIGKPFAIVEFSFISQGQEWFFLRRVEGALSDSAHDSELRRGKKLSPLVMSDVFATCKFMENEPPEIHMLIMVYSYALPVLVAESEFDGSGKAPIAKVTPRRVLDSLVRQFATGASDARAFSLPRLDWVTKALERLVHLGLATRSERTGGAYQIPLARPRKKDLIEFLGEKMWAREVAQQRTREADQPNLFDS